MAVMEKVGDRFEPEAIEHFGEEYALMASIAISLKRIADTMDGTASGICVTETLIGGQAHGR